MSEASRRPRLVHITTVPESLGFLTGQVSYMKTRGFVIHAISSPGELLDRFEEQEKVEVHPVLMSRRITPLRDLFSLGRIVFTLRKIRPTIVHAHTPKGGLLGMIAAWLTGVPVRIYHIHGLPLMTATGRKRKILHWTEKTACKLATQVLCVSHSIRNVAIMENLCPEDKIKVLLSGSINGVDSKGRFNPLRVGERARIDTRTRFGIPEDAVVIGFVGRIVRDKGLVELVDAWKVLRNEFPELRLLVVGPFEPQDPVPQETEEILRNDSRIILTGSDWNTPPFYAAMDILALPTYREGFPVVPMEAASMALPVVATAIPGCIDAVVDNETGTLVEPGNSAALADAIRKYVKYPGLRKAHGIEGRRRMLSEFKQEEIWKAMCAEYSHLLEGIGLPPVFDKDNTEHDEEIAA
ncbi:MAG TPA: glycosyltransferase family 4 protein [Armatimonadota bacterium]|nr:glycosyltransferase family 4 protein [Armatimonadota bacterium]